MEELLNKLIEKGWKPRGLLNEVEYIKAFKDTMQGWRVDISYGDHGYYKSIREITSKESGLWQFVCENKLVKTKDKKVRFRYEDLERTQNYFSWYGYEYRIIESALKDESELEKFLLDNIKIE